MTQSQDDIRLLIVAREFPTKSGPIDALGLDKDGEIYIVETKLYKNPDKRTVVAQVLDYGASLWRNASFEEFLSEIDMAVHKKLDKTFTQRLEDFFGIGDAEVSNLKDNLKRNLKEGNFKFVVLMDKLHPQLRDLVVFINQNSQFDIFAVELEYYKYENYEIMIPKLFGAEVKKDINVTAGTRKKWDESSFLQDAKNKLKDDQLKALETLFNFSKKTADEITWGTGNTIGSFNPKFSRISVRSLYGVMSDGRLYLNCYRPARIIVFPSS